MKDYLNKASFVECLIDIINKYTTCINQCAKKRALSELFDILLENGKSLVFSF